MAESESQNLSAVTKQDYVGSRYALEVAFQTMKERCQNLQQRLAKVEDENSRLRLQKKKEDFIETKGLEDLESMRDKLIELERQKQQLLHHILMVTCENKQLWTRLSQFTKLNQSVGGQLMKISDALNRHTPSNLNPSQTCNNNEASSLGDKLKNSAALSQSPQIKEAVVPTSSSDPHIDSLEEISLKLINSLLQEKLELEDECAQMTELCRGGLSPSFSADHLGISMTSTSDLAGEEGELMDPRLVPEVQQLRDSLLSIQQDLLNQQENMKAAVTNLLKLRGGGLKCQVCLERSKNGHEKALEEASRMSNATTARFESASIAEPESLGDSADEEIIEQLQRIPGDPDGSTHLPPVPICPICGRIYPSNAAFEDFHHHVVQHFIDDFQLSSPIH